ncbi:MAG: sigma-70 family RNA polymerase sigma factor [Bdellovibrionales bacterium]|nr:sigma-70 family RNA polymerase sigma factor [Bdellovibrionales bacterium]
MIVQAKPSRLDTPKGGERKLISDPFAAYLDSVKDIPELLRAEEYGVTLDIRTKTLRIHELLLSLPLAESSLPEVDLKQDPRAALNLRKEQASLAKTMHETMGKHLQSGDSAWNHQPKLVEDLQKKMKGQELNPAPPRLERELLEKVIEGLQKCRARATTPREIEREFGARVPRFMAIASEIEGLLEARKPLLDTMVTHSVARNVRHARAKWSGNGAWGAVSPEDFIGERITGDYEALLHFEPERGLKYDTYADHWRRNMEMKQYYNVGREIRIPVYLQKQAYKLRQLEGGLSSADLTSTKIADHLQIPETQAEKMLQARATMQRLVPTRILRTGEGDEDSFEIETTRSDLRDPADGAADAEEKLLQLNRLRSAMTGLPPRAALVLTLRFGLPQDEKILSGEKLRNIGLSDHEIAGINFGEVHTLQEIGKLLGVTPERVRQLEKDAIQKRLVPDMLRRTG